VARITGSSLESFCRWAIQAEIDEVFCERLPTDEREGLRLRRLNRVLEQKTDILQELPYMHVQTLIAGTSREVRSDA
jgi:hypothetical protein